MDEQPWTDADDDRVIVEQERNVRRAADIRDTIKDGVFVISAIAIGYWFLWTMWAVTGFR